MISCANKAATVELRQIRSFLSIAETLHFGRTAELIHISQPALSLQIRALEEEVGVRLFERDRRKTTLTAAGVAFRNDAAAALSQLDQAIRKARLAADGTLGLLRIARRARAREAYEKMYPLNKDDPYGVKRPESCRAQTPAGIQRACNRIMRDLGLGELTDGQGSEQSKERLEPREIDRNAYCRPTVRPAQRKPTRLLQLSRCY